MLVSRWKPFTIALLGGAFACAGVGLVTAQTPPPPVQAPPEETTAEPVPPPSPTPADPQAPADPASEAPPAPGLDDPAPYTVLGPESRRAQAEAEAEPALEVPEEVVEEPVEPGPPPPPPRRPRHAKAVVQALDKVTAETLRFEISVDRPVRYKSLVFRLNGCETEAVNEPLKEAVAHLTVTSQPKPQPGRVRPEAAQVFRGWMFASSPGLNPLEHPVYDAWLIACRTSEPVLAEASR